MARTEHNQKKYQKCHLEKQNIADVCGQKVPPEDTQDWRNDRTGTRARIITTNLGKKMSRILYVARKLHLKIIRIGAMAATVTRTRVQIQGVKGRMTAKY